MKGILFFIHLLKAGLSVDDIVIVDPAGGFGGTWFVMTHLQAERCADMLVIVGTGTDTLA
jgi:hypothetical protein